jgi:hypothetical protein
LKAEKAISVKMVEFQDQELATTVKEAEKQTEEIETTRLDIWRPPLLDSTPQKAVMQLALMQRDQPSSSDSSSSGPKAGKTGHHSHEDSDGMASDGGASSEKGVGDDPLEDETEKMRQEFARVLEEIRLKQEAESKELLEELKRQHEWGQQREQLRLKQEAERKELLKELKIQHERETREDSGRRNDVTGKGTGGT